MNKMLVAVFENENNAFEALSALKDLHRKGDVTLYATAVVSKDDTGALRMNTAADQGPIGTTTGLLTGSLIGLIGGPVGLAVGATTGALAGLIYDVSDNDINLTFLEEVSDALTKGKTAVIAEIDETWTVPVDTRLEALDAMIFRRLRDEVAEDQLARESEAIAAEFNELEEELKQAREEDKAAIKSAMAKLQNKAKFTEDLVKRKLNETKGQLDAKVNTMQEQMQNAKERRTAKIEKRITEVKQEYKARTDKLKKASSLISEALTPRKEEAKILEGMETF
ncbi:MAG: DUF1269 domain-containing protein [Chitinophagaceae bacterium]